MISLNSPTDPVEKLVLSAANESDINAESSATEQLRHEVRAKLGLDLPVFLLSLGSLADCDTLYKIPERSHQEMLTSLTSRYGNWDEISNYYYHLLEFSKQMDVFKPDSSVAKSYSKNELNELLNSSKLTLKNLLEISDKQQVDYALNDLFVKFKDHAQLYGEFKGDLSKLTTHFETIQENSAAWKTYVPAIYWNGFKNQYFLWLFGDEERGRGGLIRGDFGNSYADNKPVGDKMWEMFPYSFFLVVVSILLAYLISIPLGIYSAYKKDTPFDRISSVIVFMLYSLPSFFVATWLLYQFANPDNLWWFPSNGVKDPDTFNKDWAWYSLDKIRHQAPYFALPIVAFTYSSFAFTSRIMRVSMVDVLGSDYIRTARAKGLSEKSVILKHALRNGLLPIITMFSNVFPAAIGGSVILETIFGIPGMGSAVYEAILGLDIPMIIAVFTLTGLLTVIGYLFADILYAIVDPRISYGKK